MTHATLQDSRFPFALVLGGVVAIALFFFMQRLVVFNPAHQPTLPTLNPVNLLQAPPPEHVTASPESHPDTSRPKAIEQPTFAHAPIIAPHASIDRSPLELPMTGSGNESVGPVTNNPGIGGADTAASDHSSLRIKARIRPMYPPRAAVAGVAGSVKTCFTVAADGSVMSPRVVGASSPAARRLLSQAALRTIRQWQFFPRISRGHPVATQGVCQSIAFKLQ